jgi:hypothetical protein
MQVVNEVCHYSVIYDNDNKIYDFSLLKSEMKLLREDHYMIDELSTLKNIFYDKILKLIKMTDYQEIIIFSYYTEDYYTYYNKNGIRGEIIREKQINGNRLLISENTKIKLPLDRGINTLILIGVNYFTFPILKSLFNNLPEHIEYLFCTSDLINYDDIKLDNLPIGLKKIVILSITLCDKNDIKKIKIPWGCELVIGDYKP